MPTQNLPGLMLDRAHPLARGLVGWWPMNEGGGTRVNDISGNNNAGAFSGITQGSTSGWAGGFNGRAVMFDGTDDAVAIPTAAPLQITGAISVCGWVNIPALSGYYIMAEKGPAYPNPYAIVTEPGGTVEWLRGNGASQSYVISTGAISAGVWQFIVGTWADGVFRIYLNGRFDNSASASPTCTDDGQALYIGMRRDAAAAMPGRIAHVRLYNRALLAAEVAQLYAEPLAGAKTPPKWGRYIWQAAAPALGSAKLSADRLYNRSGGRVWRRGDTG